MVIRSILKAGAAHAPAVSLLHLRDKLPLGDYLGGSQHRSRLAAEKKKVITDRRTFLKPSLLTLAGMTFSKTGLADNFPSRPMTLIV